MFGGACPAAGGCKGAVPAAASRVSTALPLPPAPPMRRERPCPAAAPRLAQVAHPTPAARRTPTGAPLPLARPEPRDVRSDLSLLQLGNRGVHRCISSVAITRTPANALNRSLGALARAPELSVAGRRLSVCHA